MSFTGTPTAQERRPPEKIFRSSDKRDCTCAVVFAYHHGDILILRIILCDGRKRKRQRSATREDQGHQPFRAHNFSSFEKQSAQG